MRVTISILYTGLLFLVFQACQSPATSSADQPADATPTSSMLKVLIIDGQNNHVMWPKTTMMMKQYLEETTLFTVDIARTAFTWKGDEYLADFPLEGGPATTAMKEPQSDPV